MSKRLYSVQKKKIKKYMNITEIIVLLFVSIYFFYIYKLKEDNYINMEEVYATEELDTKEEIVLNSNRYLKLDEDFNAEDAEYVFKNTQGLVKGITTYPVREDGMKVAYLTFDDGPSIENTNNILNVLDSYNIKATFFITGSSISRGQEEKELLKKIAYNGHAIGNHSFSHDYKVLYPNGIIDADAFMADIEKNNRVLKSVLGEDFNTRIIRFPGGYWSWGGRAEVRRKLDDLGYVIVDWNALNEDAQGKRKNADELVEVTKENVKVLGSKADSIIFLMHDTYGKAETVKALPRIIDLFKEKGFTFKTIK